MEAVSRFKRFVAHIIDVIISGIVMFTAMFGYGLVLLFGNYLADPEKINSDPIYLIPATIIGYMLLMLYYTFFESSKHCATPGKMLLKMQVVTKEGKKLTFLRSCSRFCILILPSIPYLFADLVAIKLIFTSVTVILLFVWFLPVYFTKNRVCLHEILSHTRVVKKVKKSNVVLTAN